MLVTYSTLSLPNHVLLCGSEAPLPRYNHRVKFPNVTTLLPNHMLWLWIAENSATSLICCNVCTYEPISHWSTLHCFWRSLSWGQLEWCLLSVSSFRIICWGSICTIMCMEVGYLWIANVEWVPGSQVSNPAKSIRDYIRWKLWDPGCVYKRYLTTFYVRGQYALVRGSVYSWLMVWMANTHVFLGTFEVFTISVWTFCT